VAAGAARDSRYRVEKRSTFSIRLCPANEQLYRPIEPDDPDIRALADSIRKEGVKEPLVVTRDNYLLSGHRRLMAARLAGLVEVPVRVEPISYAKNRDRCVALLATYNRQRVKTNAELLNEEVVLADKDTAWAALREQRARESDLSGFSAGESINCAGPKIRRRISKAKLPFLDAAKRVIVDRRDYWPLSDRQIHYALLNDPPLRHAGKRASRYQNDRCSYKDLTDLLTRARLAGLISWAAIDDPTRPLIHAKGWPNVQEFVRRHLDRLFNGYYRNCQQSQAVHVEVVAEKLTVQSIVESVTNDFGVPLTIARGYPSIEPRRQIAERFRKSGKERLVLFVVSALDPEGVDIAQSLVSSLRDDFDIDETVIRAVRVAVTPEQVATLQLPPMMEAKTTSARYKSFAAKYGTYAYELEALPPQTLQAALRDAINGAMDPIALNAEIDAEKEDAAFLKAAREQAIRALGRLMLDGEGGAE